jgi:hypothetical protein
MKYINILQSKAPKICPNWDYGFEPIWQPICKHVFYLPPPEIGYHSYTANIQKGMVLSLEKIQLCTYR